MKNLTQCKFSKPWQGQCEAKTDKAHGFCLEHAQEKCWKCKKQAASGCDNAGFMVCGIAQCAKHPHLEWHNKEFDRVMNQKDCPRCNGTGKVDP